MYMQNTDLLMVTLSVSGAAQIAGEDYTLTCAVTGGGTMMLTYRWWKDGVLLTGRTASAIVFRPLQQISSGVYICAGTRNSIAVNSASVTLTVQGEIHRMEAIPTLVSLCRSTFVSCHNS